MSTQPAHERYQPKPFIGSSHSWAIERLRGLAPGSALDIGPGSGLLGAELRKLGWRKVDAVETDPRTREQLASLYTDIQPSLATLRPAQYDLVLLLDVLEHMSDPESFVGELAPFLHPSSTVLVSVPNVAHWSSRLMLLFGLFPLATRGIHDRTHSRFFTRRTFHALLRRIPHSRIEDTSSTIVPLELFLPAAITRSPAWRLMSRLRLSLAWLLPGLFAFQHLACVRIE